MDEASVATLEREPSEVLSTGAHGPLKQHQCHVCYRQFSRLEHLTRHGRSHASDRPLKCRYCHKGFYRIDALRRHELVHSHPQGLAKGLRACSRCVAARTKCSGGEVCNDCQKRSLPCDYLQRNSNITSRGSSRQGSDGSEPQECITNVDDLPRIDSSMGMPSPVRPDAREPPLGTVPSQQDEQNYVPMTDHLSDIDNRIHTAQAAQGAVSSESDRLYNIDSGSPDIWQQKDLLITNWSFDDLPSPHDSIAINQDVRPDEPSPMSLTSSQQDTTSPRDFDRGLCRTSTSHTSPSDSLDYSRHGTSDRASCGRFYVDGDVARLPRTRTALPNQLKPPESSGFNDGSPSPVIALDVYIFLEATIKSLSESPSRPQLLPQATYEAILACYQNTCVAPSFFVPFESPNFPTSQILNYFISLFLENFPSTLPFIHIPTFVVGDTPWLLTLAMSAIGSHYADTADPNLCSAMHEFLRRAICFHTENQGHLQPRDQILVVQAKLLNYIGLAYSSSRSAAAHTTSWQFDLRDFYDNQWTNHLTKLNTIPHDRLTTRERWKNWYEIEGLKRLGFSIWLLDSMSVFHFLMRPQTSNEDTGIPLPCQEVIWEATTERDWDQLHSCAIPSPSIQTALQQLYIEKRLQPSTGEFSRVLLIHALYRRTWEVEAYFQQPLTQWTPTAERQRASLLPGKTAIWLPSIPAYTKWRNSACDCLDVLHWHANSVIGAASGMEHPTVMHLHLARVVLLAPFRDIVKLATLTTAHASSPPDAEVTNLRHRIQKWAREDQYKARLAIIHAGVLLWHVRRYSISSFPEAQSVLLATLCLWAYGTCAQHTQVEDDEPDYPTIIQLDRPADDELVQLFISRGEKMNALLTGVGNICSPRGPERVLREGRKVLTTLRVWGDGRKGGSLLASLMGRS